MTTPAEAKTLLDVKGLSTDFEMKRGTVKAVRDVSFTVRQGEVLAIVGESGSGKSVAALSVMRLLLRRPPRNWKANLPSVIRISSAWPSNCRACRKIWKRTP